jgi:hypothetical protein
MPTPTLGEAMLAADERPLNCEQSPHRGAAVARLQSCKGYGGEAAELGPRGGRRTGWTGACASHGCQQVGHSSDWPESAIGSSERQFFLGVFVEIGLHLP